MGAAKLSSIARKERSRAARFSLSDFDATTQYGWNPGFQPLLHLPVEGGGPVPDVDDKDNQPQGLPVVQIGLRETLPALLLRSRGLRVAVAGQVDEVNPAVDPEEIDGSRATRGLAGPGQDCPVRTLAAPRLASGPR